MLGLKETYALTKSNYFEVSHANGKSNPIKVNLQPWDAVSDVEKSNIYPDGRRVIPAASQDDFKSILARNGGKHTLISENPLPANREKLNLESLAKNCQWFKDQQAKENKPVEATNTFGGPSNLTTKK